VSEIIENRCKLGIRKWRLAGLGYFLPHCLNLYLPHRSRKRSGGVRPMATAASLCIELLCVASLFWQRFGAAAGKG
jgi:hypothetical protein